jgi:hypothetical protein
LRLVRFVAAGFFLGDDMWLFAMLGRRRRQASGQSVEREGVVAVF